MPYVSVTKDLSAVKPKVVGNLTGRQIVFFVLGTVLGFTTYHASARLLGKEVAGFVMVIAVMPCFLFALYQKNGQPMEKLLKNYIETRLIRNKPRPYITENIYSDLLKNMECRTQIERLLESSNTVGKEWSHISPKDKKSKKSIIIDPRKKLDKRTKKLITDAVKKAKRDGKIPNSAQQTIPYKHMYRDGICKIDGNTYSKTIQFYDINYELESTENKNEIFENWCDVLNYYDHTVHVHLDFINIKIHPKELEKSIFIAEQDDNYNDVRKEFKDMLLDKLRSGNNGLLKMKYITYSVKAETYRDAKMRLEKITADTLTSFKRNGVPASPLNGYERLHLLYRLFHEGEEDRFVFHWDAVYQTGNSTKDFIAPNSFDFREGVRLDARHYFKVGDRIGNVSYLNILAPELTDRLLASFLNMENNIIVSLHVDSLEQTKAIKEVKRYLSDIQKMKIEEQKKAVKIGYDMDILPPDIITYEGEATELLKDLQSRNERRFMVTITIVQTAKTKKELDNQIFQAKGIAQQYNCQLNCLDDRQEQGYVSALPIGGNSIEIVRGLTTTSTAIFVPFTTVELFQSGEAQYYGQNALSNNLIMVSRKKLKNPNGLILGKPGGGKSFAAKREILNAFLVSDDDILISDPESEYGSLVRHLGGQVIKLSLNSKEYVNPLDINLNYSDEDKNTESDPISLKCEFILSLCELILGGKKGLEPDEEGIIDRCARKIYEKWEAEPIMENIPILGDLHQEFLKVNTAKSIRLADGLERYVTGSYSVFNHQTNIDIKNRIVCYDIKDLGKMAKKIGMLIVQDQVWNRVTMNRGIKYTRYYDDEFHLKFKDKQTTEYSVEIWKRFRKFGGIPTGITQNAVDLLKSSEIETILSNSDFIYMLSQDNNDAAILSDVLGISPEQLKYVVNAPEGEGLIFYGDRIVPTKDSFPKNTISYSLMTTKPEERKAYEESKKKNPED